MKILTSAIFCFAFGTAFQAQAEMPDGKALHESSCTRCHAGDVYTRPNRRVNDLPSLGSQVRFCKDNLGISWFDEDVNHVVDYLNKNYYKF